MTDLFYFCSIFVTVEVEWNVMVQYSCVGGVE